MLNAFGPEICADFVVMLMMLSVARVPFDAACQWVWQSVAGIAVRHQAKILQRTNCQRQLCCGRSDAGDKTRKSLMKIACKWFLFLPACHVMVARFACKTFGLLSARHTHTHTPLHWLWLCAKAAKAKSLPRTWTWKSRLPDALNSKFSHIFLDSLCVGVVVDCSWSCAHTHTHTCIYGLSPTHAGTLHKQRVPWQQLLSTVAACSQALSPLFAACDSCQRHTEEGSGEERGVVSAAQIMVKCLWQVLQLITWRSQRCADSPSLLGKYRRKHLQSN